MTALDLARAVAASYVVLHHLAQSYGLTGGAGIVFRFGQEAVLIFFLLSGFVIFANEKDRALDTRAYFVRRIQRIYPLLLVAMAVSCLVALHNGTFDEQFSWQELLGNLLSLEDVSGLKPGVLVEPFMGNSPLWSLSYEVAFYVMFPLILRQWRRSPQMTNHLVGMGAVLCYILYAAMPNHWALVGAYFLVWWCGAIAANAYESGGRSFLTIGTPLHYLMVLCVAAAAVVVWQGYKGFGVYPFLPLRHFAAALIFLVLLFSSVGARIATYSQHLERPAAALASISYGLYILHYPLLIRWDYAHSIGGFVIAFMVLMILATLFDRLLSGALRMGRARNATVQGVS
ncbi:acyltransferase family protein [Bosea sp. (in: a-proteobacteria)]|uniref:acyltransferase family protein n=1 Tax=Bosea sp. (in: a-proteobacteria) TaxID=1871050 RepID=UPI0035675D41